MENGKKADPRECSISCNYLNIEMDYPRTRSHVEDFLWYLYHDVEVYIGNDGEWYINSPGKYSHLAKNGTCAVDSRQPEICAQHSDNGAKKLNDVVRYRFKTEVEFLLYIKERRPALFKKLNPQTRKLAAGGKPPLKNKRKKNATATTDCSDCGKCCTYLNIAVDRPANGKDVNTLLWYQSHDNADLYFDNDGDYSLVFYKPCEHLDENSLCGIYSRRPSICRRFSKKDCHGTDFNDTVKAHFDTEKKLLGFLKKRRPGLFRKLNPKVRALAPI